ncbi:MAG: response regulator [Caldilineaceae bacterium]
MVYKILIAEDEVTMRRLMVTLLRRHNHEVIEAGNGEEAFAMAYEHQPDIILLDVMMPLADGFEAVKRLRANPETESIPVIFLSAKGQVEDRVEGLRLGGDDYIIKPAEPAELMARIDSVILRSRRERAAARDRFLASSALRAVWARPRPSPIWPFISTTVGARLS